MSKADLPSGKFGVVSADPPWTFETWSDRGKEKSPEKHYACMSLREIRALSVADRLRDDAALFLWATWPMIFHARRVMEAWGFAYSGLAWEWIKHSPETDKFAYGLGYGSRKNLEPCLLGRRGRPVLRDRSIRDFLLAPRREHSRKPDEHYERIERMFDGPYLELFARETRPGWTAWGLEAGKFDRPRRRQV